MKPGHTGSPQTSPRHVVAVAVLLALGVIRQRQGDGHAATLLFREVLYLDPNHAQAHEQLSDLQTWESAP